MPTTATPTDLKRPFLPDEMELYRPNPPEDYQSPVDLEYAQFQPAPELGEWARNTFIAEDGPLYNPIHVPLAGASIGFLWCSAAYSKRGQRVQGTAYRCRAPQSMFGWEKAAWYDQHYKWFGPELPEFKIVLCAPECWGLDDANFCAVVDHELGHCCQLTDEWGGLVWDQMGNPVWSMRGHTCEEFDWIIARYGLEVSPGAAAIVEAAKRPPLFKASTIKIACGTCRY